MSKATVSRGVLVSVDFGRFATCKCARFHCNTENINQDFQKLSESSTFLGEDKKTANSMKANKSTWYSQKLSTRMHSSRMRTGRLLLTVCRSLLPGEGVSALGGVCSWGGVSAPRGVCSWGGCLLPGWCLLPGGVCVSAPRGVCLLPGGCVFVCLLPGGCVSAPGQPPCEQNDKQVQKYYLGHNFIAAGKNIFVTRNIPIGCIPPIC